MPVPSNAKLIYSLLTAAGLSANAAAGILGNIEQESGGDTQAGSYPGSYGLIQWTPANQSTYTVPNNSSVATQVGYILKYIAANGSISDINKNATSPSAAALYFSNNYERPLASAANNPNREQSAVEVAQAAQSGNWPQAAALSDVTAATSDSISTPIGNIGIPGLSDVTNFFNGIIWLTKPSSWLRIGAFALAFVFVIGAVIVFTKADTKIKLPSAVPIPVPV